MSEDREVVLAVQNVIKSYAGHTKHKIRTKALDGVTFHLHEGNASD